MSEICVYCSKVIRGFVCWECHDNTRIELEEKIEALEKAVEELRVEKDV